ncbi:hypothetical protein E8E13_000263 [Curvularia kusanoi]|uniref:C3H1-type domain-containing protein n=1 Tax=Curvularia kusanoi TaxID=90978 RepID=A0A9P4T666_CURKU|nr:hypothetical protein E8E13_000263 [Curvularia kusanoi]
MNGDPTGGVEWPGVQNTTQLNALSQEFWKAQDALKRLRQEGVQRNSITNEDAVSVEEEQHIDEKDHDDAAVSGRSAPVSPNSSDYSLPSDINDRLERANTKPPEFKKRTGPCPLVNKPGGCPDREKCLYTYGMPSSTQAPAEPASRTSNSNPVWPTKPQQTLQQPQQYNQNPMQTDMLGPGINMNAERFDTPQSSNWAQSRGQPLCNAGPPPNAPRGPRQQDLPAETMPVGNVQARNGRGGEVRIVKRKRGPFVEDDDSDTDSGYKKQKKGGGWNGGGRKGNGRW